MFKHNQSINQSIFSINLSSREKRLFSSAGRRLRKYGETVGETEMLDVVLQVLTQLCEGHNAEAQDLLRVQANSTVNIIQDLVGYFDALVPPTIPNPWSHAMLGSDADVAMVKEHLTALYSPLLRVLDTISETVQGPCVGNQNVLLEGVGLEALRSLLTLKTTLETTFLVLTGGGGGAFTGSSSTGIGGGGGSAQSLSLNKSVMEVCHSAEMMGELKKVYEGSAGEREVFGHACVLLSSLLEGPNNATNIRILVNKGFVSLLHHKLKIYAALIHLFSGSDKEITLGLVNEAMPLYTLLSTLLLDSTIPHDIRVFDRYTGRVEIVRNESVEPFIFHKNLLSRWLTKEDRENVLWSVDRSTMGDKIEDFHGAAIDLKETFVIREATSKNKIRKRLTSPKMANYLRFFANIIVVVLQVFVVLSSADEENEDSYDTILLVLGSILTAALLIHSLSFLFLEARIQTRVKYRREQEAILSANREKGKLDTDLPRWKVHWLWVKNFLSTRATYHFFLLAAAVCGLAISPMYYTILTVDLIIQSPILINVLNSVSKNWRSLFVTLLLILLVVYFYAVIAWLYFSDTFDKNPDDEENPENMCSSILTCWVALVAQFPTGGDWLRERMTQSGKDTPGRGAELAFQITFFIIIVSILMNIIFGIIIDTFSELREERAAVLDDITSRCFICGLETAVFDREGEGFERHISHEHYMWDYVHLYTYIMTKDPTEYTGTESYIREMFDSDNLGFYPLNRARTIQTKVRRLQKKSDGAASEALLRDVLGKIGSLAKHVTGLERDTRKKEGQLKQIADNLRIQKRLLETHIQREDEEAEAAALAAAQGPGDMHTPKQAQ
eukprot:GCRY01004603.1.p1 GENE.GCRY01004603.1~~GCRY01004603.1.p1  ORF type:complete len:842 (+),score=278.49 GCRY01004603.1:182-2707(+)